MPSVRSGGIRDTPFGFPKLLLAAQLPQETSTWLGTSMILVPWWWTYRFGSLNLNLMK
jgi:hypothetical protein